MDLKKRAKEKFEQRELERKHKELEELNKRLIESAPIFEFKDFYCDNCDDDFKAIGIKIELSVYSFAYYRTQCPNCKKDCQRFIVDIEQDPYFYKSKMLRVERRKHYIDMLQPGDEGFETYYGKKYREQN
jgi:hypothetical protein